MEKVSWRCSRVFGVSVVAQLGVWIHQSWVTQDWTALGVAAAGGLIVVAGVGSVVGEWRRLYRLRERAEERDFARELLHSHGMGQGKVFVKNWQNNLRYQCNILRLLIGKPLS